MNRAVFREAMSFMEEQLPSNPRNSNAYIIRTIIEIWERKQQQHYEDWRDR